LELAAVIGRAGRDIRKVDAASHIFGYTIWNDVSARDVQRREVPIGIGPAKAKDWDGSNVLGPCIVTADEFDPSHLTMRVRVNSENPRVFFLYEQYVNQAGYEAHMATPHFEKYVRGDAIPNLESRERPFYETI
jgi:2-keto-4-pentenoate hydratase/2-oxohepta-3-ene-1,7-dioic acid hydratase in catechol pathway